VPTTSTATETRSTWIVRSAPRSWGNFRVSPFPKEEAAAGSLVAPLPGVVNEVKVKKGDTVSAGDVLLVIDSMKVFHWISAPLSGRIAEIRVQPGNHVDCGAVLVVIDKC